MKRVLILLMVLFVASTAWAAQTNSPRHGITEIDDVIAKGPWTDIRAFGAVCDGVTDDTAAFTSAIAYAGIVGINTAELLVPNTGSECVITSLEFDDADPQVILRGMGSRAGVGGGGDGSEIQCTGATAINDACIDFNRTSTSYSGLYDIKVSVASTVTSVVRVGSPDNGGRLSNVTIDGNNQANYGVWFEGGSHFVGSEIQSINLTGFNYYFHDQVTDSFFLFYGGNYGIATSGFSAFASSVVSGNFQFVGERIEETNNKDLFQFLEYGGGTLYLDGLVATSGTPNSLIRRATGATSSPVVVANTLRFHTNIPSYLFTDEVDGSNTIVATVANIKGMVQLIDIVHSKDLTILEDLTVKGTSNHDGDVYIDDSTLWISATVAQQYYEDTTTSARDFRINVNTNRYQIQIDNDDDAYVTAFEVEAGTKVNIPIGVGELLHDPQSAEATTKEGTVAYANSTNWNPGDGKGLYSYDGTTWVSLEAAAVAGTISATAGTNITVNGSSVSMVAVLSDAYVADNITASSYQPLDATLTDLANAPLTESNSIGNDALPETISVGDITATTTLDIPSGTACDSTEAGEICIDTSNDQLIFYGAAARVVPYVHEGKFALAGTSFVQNTGEYPAGKEKYNVTITDIHCITDTGTVLIELMEGTGTSYAGGTSVDAPITCDSTGAEDDGALTNPTIDAGDWIAARIGTDASSPTIVGITWYYTVDRQ